MIRHPNEHSTSICFRKVFRVLVEPFADRLCGVADAVLWAELLRHATQTIESPHRSAAHLTIEIFSVDSRVRLAKDDHHPIVRDRLLIPTIVARVRRGVVAASSG